VDKRAVEIARFDQAVALIRQRFPDLHMEITHDHPHVEALATISAQPPRLQFEVSINLQNRDELHLNAAHLWTSWFPCGEESVFGRFVEAVLGLLSGEYRILESFVARQHASSKLQKPAGSSWQTVASGASLAVLIPWKRRSQVVQNRPVA
jgi:hypothetical protein